MTTPPIQRIVLATDLGPSSQRLLAHGARLALAAKARLCVLHAPHNPDGPPRSWDVRLDTLLRGWKIEANAPGSLDDIDLVQVTAQGSDPLSALTQVAGALGPDLLLLGTERRHGMERILQGSTAERLARHFSVGTLFLGQGARSFVQMDSGAISLQRVLVPIGADIHPRDAVDAATAFLSAIGQTQTELRLFHAAQSPNEFASVLEEAGMDLPWSWRKGAAVAGILAEATACQADLVAMVTRGHDSVGDDILGSRTERVMRDGPCPVLAVPLKL
ncbi:MAG: universal stress protein [Oligoflexia bacterium]|nr:universal stress protein [Oligoflexia bacterium]